MDVDIYLCCQVELDSVGCQPGCATLADGRHEHHFLVARPDVSLLLGKIVCM